MKTYKFFLALLILCLSAINYGLHAQSGNCAGALPYCTGTTETFPANADGSGAGSGPQGEAGPDYDCLATTPNPAWYYMLIDQSGNIDITISQTTSGGSGTDVDFIVWGPFTSATGPCTAQLTSGNVVDCSYSTASTEVANIPNGQNGEYYLFMITNFANQAADITFSQTGGSGSTDCSITLPCNISSLTATAGACNPVTNTYDVSGSLTFADPPTTGTLTITDGSGANQSFNAPFSSPTNYNLTGLVSDGNSHSLTATFSDNTSCTITINYTAPPPCACPDPTINPLGPFCANDPASSLTAATPGGTWTGNGVSGSNFNPATSGAGTHTISYSVTTNGCTQSDTENVIVNPVPNATITSIGPFCETAAPNGLSSVTLGGTWSGNGVTGTNFSPTSAGIGTHIISYTVTINGCMDSDTESIVVNANPDATITPPAAFCPGDPPANITSATNGGTWSGTGITNAANGTFDPSAAGVGTHNITYSVTVNGCTDSDTENIVINSFLDATIILSGPYCNGTPAVNLSAIDAGGTWSGNGITNASSGTFNPSTAGVGTHNITYSIPGSCGDSDTEDFVVNSVPDASITPTGPFCSADAPVVLVSATGGGNWSGSGITNSSNGDFSPTAAGAGTHVITYTVGTTCQDSDTEAIVVNQSMDAAVTPAGPFCTSDPALNLTAVDVGGTWTGTGITNSTTGAFDPAIAGNGTHSIIYSISGSCGDSHTESIIVSSQMDATISPAGPYCDNDGVVTLSGAMGGGTWSGAGITNVSTGIFNPNIAGSGTHAITYTIPGSCGDTDVENIIVNQTYDATISAVGNSCPGDPPFNMNAVDNGTGLWSGVGITDVNNGTFDPFVAGTGTHQIIYEINASCGDSDTINVVVTNTLDATINSVSPFCSDEPPVDFTSVDGGGTWTGTGVVNSIAGTFNPASAGAGTHVISYSIAGGCGDTDTLSVVVDPALDATISSGGPFCIDANTVFLNAADSGGTWIGTGIVNSLTGEFSPLIASLGTHTITYQLSQHCGDTATQSFIVDGVQITSIDSFAVKCFGDCNGLVVIHATNAIAYSIDNGITYQASDSFPNLCAGVYNVMVQSTFGCTDGDKVEVITPPDLSMSFAKFNASCFNGCNGNAIVIPAGGNGGYTYSWSPPPATGQGQPSANGFCAGNYILTIGDNKGCSIDTNFTISQPTQVNIYTSSSNSNCGQFNGSASVDSANGGTGSFSYLWDTNAASQTSSTATGLVPGSYVVTVTDGASCDSAVTVVVGNTPGPSVNTTYTEPACQGNCLGTATAVITGGTSPYSFSWDSPSGIQTTQTATGMCADNYSVTVTDALLCPGVGNVTLLEPTILLVIAGPPSDTTICTGTGLDIVAVASGGISPYSYSWSNTFVGPGPHPVSPTFDQCYYVTVTDQNQCISSPDSVCVNILPPINASVTSTTPFVCEGDQANLSVSATGGLGAPYDFLWASGNTASTESVVPLGSTPDSIYYAVTVTDNCSPVVFDSVLIQFFPQPDVQFYVDSTFGCAPYSVNLTNQTGNSSDCVWDLGDGTVINDCSFFSHTYDLASTYYVNLTVTSNDGCTAMGSQPAEVLVNPLPMAAISTNPDTTTQYDTEFSFIQAGFGNINYWEWSIDGPVNNFVSDTLGFGDNPYWLTTLPIDTGVYTISLYIETPAGCFDQTTETVRIEGIYKVNVPNAFTPNADGLNDTFFPVAMGIDKADYSLFIINRWGDVIFESHDINDPWDGTAREKGGTKIVQQDVYIWKLIVKDAIHNKQNEYVGHVTVLRN